MRCDTRWALTLPTVWVVDATEGGRGAWPLPRPHSPSGQSPQSGHALHQNGEEVPVRAGRRALGLPVGPRPCPAGPTAGEYGGRAPCNSGLVGAWQQAKGGDAWWAAGRRAGPGSSASSPDRGSTRAADAPAGRSPTTPVRAPRRPATGAAGRAAFTAGRSIATATCSTWSTAPGRWWRSWTGCGGSGGRASAAVRGRGCGHGVDGWRRPPRGAARLAPGRSPLPPHGDGQEQQREAHVVHERPGPADAADRPAHLPPAPRPPGPKVIHAATVRPPLDEAGVGGPGAARRVVVIDIR